MRRSLVKVLSLFFFSSSGATGNALSCIVFAHVPLFASAASVCMVFSTARLHLGVAGRRTHLFVTTFVSQWC